MTSLFVKRLLVLAWKGILLALLFIVTNAEKEESPVWSGNMKFTDDGFLTPEDTRRIQHEIKMVEIDCGNVCDTRRKESKKVGVGRYEIDELTKDVDCDVLFESSYLDGINPKNTAKEEFPVPRLIQLPEETKDLWTFDGQIPSVAFHVDNISCPYKDNGPSKGWGLDDFKRYHGDVWDRKQNKYLWSEELMEGLQRAYRNERMLSKEEGRAENERSQYVGGMISFNKLVGGHMATWKEFPDFSDLVDVAFRDGYMLGIHSRIHLAEFEEHLSHHILNRTGSGKWNEVKHVLVIGSKYPWIEGVLLAKGVEKITSLVSNPELTRSEHPNITIVSYSDLSKKWEDGSFSDEKDKFDAIIAYNSLGVWHGIGGFGHPSYSVINPWADAVTLNKAWCLSKKRARALVALPMTHEFEDLVTFNTGKFYGKLQLSHLFTNWKQVPEDYDYKETMKDKFTFKKDKKDKIGASSMDSPATKTQDENTTVETCKKEDGVNCSPDETKDTTTTDDYSNMPTSLGGIPIYILERP